MVGYGLETVGLPGAGGREHREAGTPDHHHPGAWARTWEATCHA